MKNHLSSKASPFFRRSMGHNDDLDALPLLNGNSSDINNSEGEAGQRYNRNSRSSSSSITMDMRREQDACKQTLHSPRQQQHQHQHHQYQEHPQQQQLGTPLPPSDIESDSHHNEGERLHHHHGQQQQRQQGGYNIRERQQHRFSNAVATARPTRSLLLARPVPVDPITDPFSLVCDIARRPKFGHQYILCPNRRESNRHGHNVGLSVGPHWSGVIYTMSIIGVITIFLVR